MALLPPGEAFPKPGSYLRYWDGTSRRVKYLYVRDMRGPLVYPRRLGSVAAGGASSKVRFQDLNMSQALNHRAKVYVGFRPGALYRVSQPVATEQLDWDENPVDIDKDLTRVLTYHLSPYDAPTFSVWIAPQNFIGIEGLNITDQALVPEVMIVAAKYWVLDEDREAVELKIPEEVLGQLRKGLLPSIPISFGGTMNA